MLSIFFLLLSLNSLPYIRFLPVFLFCFKSKYFALSHLCFEYQNCFYSAAKKCHYATLIRRILLYTETPKFEVCSCGFSLNFSIPFVKLKLFFLEHVQEVVQN